MFYLIVARVVRRGIYQRLIIPAEYSAKSGTRVRYSNIERKGSSPVRRNLPQTAVCGVRPHTHSLCSLSGMISNIIFLDLSDWQPDKLPDRHEDTHFVDADLHDCPVDGYVLRLRCGQSNRVSAFKFWPSLALRHPILSGYASVFAQPYRNRHTLAIALSYA
jgi:hypothetical protein